MSPATQFKDCWLTGLPVPQVSTGPSEHPPGAVPPKSDFPAWTHPGCVRAEHRQTVRQHPEDNGRGGTSHYHGRLLHCCTSVPAELFGLSSATWSVCGRYVCVCTYVVGMWTVRVCMYVCGRYVDGTCVYVRMWSVCGRYVCVCTYVVGMCFVF